MTDYRTVPLSRGMFAIVDTEDYEAVSRYRWFAHQSRPGGAFYAITHRLIDGKKRYIAMHRFVMNAPEGVRVDHIHGMTLDNRKSQLRFATPQENNRNRAIGGKFKGVNPVSGGSRWRAEIVVDTKPLYLGAYDTAEDAALAYDAKARELFGVFARLNFPDRNEAPKRVREGLRPTNTSGYLGVTFNKSRGLWRAQITDHGKRLHLGYYDAAEDAARAFDYMARRVFGDQARLNFPNDPEVTPNPRRSTTGPKSRLPF